MLNCFVWAEPPFFSSWAFYARLTRWILIPSSRIAKYQSDLSDPIEFNRGTTFFSVYSIVFNLWKNYKNSSSSSFFILSDLLSDQFSSLLWLMNRSHFSSCTLKQNKKKEKKNVGETRLNLGERKKKGGWFNAKQVSQVTLTNAFLIVGSCIRYCNCTLARRLCPRWDEKLEKNLFFSFFFLFSF